QIHALDRPVFADGAHLGPERALAGGGQSLAGGGDDRFGIRQHRQDHVCSLGSLRGRVADAAAIVSHRLGLIAGPIPRSELDPAPRDVSSHGKAHRAACAEQRHSIAPGHRFLLVVGYERVLPEPRRWYSVVWPPMAWGSPST